MITALLTALLWVWTIANLIITMIGLGGIPDDVRTWARWLRALGGIVDHNHARWVFVCFGLSGIALAWLPWGGWLGSRDIAPAVEVLAQKPVVESSHAAGGVGPQGTREFRFPQAPLPKKTLQGDLSPSAIIYEILHALPGNKEAIRQKYIGVEVSWTCSVISAQRASNGVTDLALQFAWKLPPSTGNQGLQEGHVTTSVLSSEYPSLEEIPKGNVVEVSGVIEKIDGTSSFKLRGARLYFEPWDFKQPQIIVPYSTGS